MPKPVSEAPVQSARTKTTEPIGNHTDLLILPMFHVDANAHDLYLIPEPKSNSLKRRVWKIKKIQAELGNEICNNILFIHAVLGCDTTSRVHGIYWGGRQYLKVYGVISILAECGNVSSNCKEKENVASGKNALVFLFNGRLG